MRPRRALVAAVTAAAAAVLALGAAPSATAAEASASVDLTGSVQVRIVEGTAYAKVDVDADAG